MKYFKKAQIFESPICSKTSEPQKLYFPTPQIKEKKRSLLTKSFFNFFYAIGAAE